MTVLTGSRSVDAALSALTYERTVPRGLVHRHALSEVFLTDAARVDDSRFVAAAQLPPLHAYYTDHTNPTALDPLLLLECCRQAETHAVHAHFGAPSGTKFVLQEWSMRLSGGAVAEAAGRPLPVTIDAATHDAQWVAGTLRGLGYRMRVAVSGRPVAEVTMRVKYVADHVYAKLRGRAGGTAPTSESYRRAATDGLVEPAQVGRRRPENVVLLDPVVTEDAVTTRLRVAGGHPSLFDHPQDHVPGMVLMEAGRQAALLSVGGSAPDRAAEWAVTGLSASFGAYAELDEPLTVRAYRSEERDTAAGASVRVGFEQGGRSVAEAAFVLERGGAGTE
ncbi:gamma-butyrolactone biosynthesis protein [Streptomyces hygroscopicus]|uniref:ScbA/BarX family gamma-butyrolactone biosynthesis protein n=1 Tax=Streptomyces hygroscopicus TaxID=1912 RepID=UPI00223E9A0E|nr:ScbA/BarX family gamma-butyrolactone biosynthesis protein [Streptomyces hygroscopicus]MCW7946257.1 gamma-butyrolactone biosynthesis protein [Streptomyces hygroscopicus]